jgi:NADH-quinone oxidoreductase subunit I
MGITGKYLVSPMMTVFYPYQQADNVEKFRGHVELVGKEDEPEISLCIACGQCARQCPSQCITVSPKMLPPDPAEAKDGKPAKPKRLKTPGVFQLDFSLCSLCGQCVQVCPVDSLRYSENFYLAVFTRQEATIDLLERLERQAKEEK